MNEAELLELKQEISNAKEETAELKGQHTLLLKQLKENWGVSSVKAGEKKLEEMEADINHAEEAIQKATDELEKQLQNEED